MTGLSRAVSVLFILCMTWALPVAAESPQELADRSTADELPGVSDLFDSHRDKVISIQTELATPMGGFGPMFGVPDGEPARGEGSGFIVDADGLAITNWHVVAGAQSIQVTTAAGSSYSARLIGADPSTDIALIEIDTPEPLPVVSLGSVQDISPGEWVIAVGSPFGLEHSVTVGVLSATGRQIGMGPYDDFLQTDASINPGNSGGPLFNLDGEVIGVNTAIIRNGRGIGFAVPIDTVTRILPHLRETGYVVRGYLGAGVQNMSRDLAETFGLDPRDGVLLRSVVPDGPADDGGLEPGDVITHVNGQRTRESPALLATVAAVNPGESTTIQYLRNGEPGQTEVTVVERPDPQRAEVERTRQPEPTTDPGRLGVVLRSVTPQMRRRLNVPEGVGVFIDRVEAGSPASGVIRQGDVLLRIGDTEVSEPNEVPSVLRQQPRDRPIRMLVQRAGEPHFLAVRINTERD